MLNMLRTLRGYDRSRRGFPGEHLGTASLGLGLLRAAGRRKSFLGRVASVVAGGALLYRAASGRKGLKRFLR